MNNDINKLLADMADVKGIDPVSWWPLAPGWWIIIGLILLIVVIILGFWWYRKKKACSWQSQALKELESVSSITELSRLIRRIALQKYNRSECAGLSGNEWLKWLKDHDPKKFDWEEKGQILLDGPYTPDVRIGKEDLDVLVKAAKRWVK